MTKDLIIKFKDEIIRERDAKIEELKETIREFYLKFGKIQRDINRDEHVDEFWLKDLFPEKQELQSLQAKLRVAIALLNDASPYIVQSWASVEYADIDEDVEIVKQRVDDYLKELGKV